MGMIKGMILQAFLLLSCSSVQFGTAVDTITASKSITYQEAIISGNSSFQLGFFSPANSTGNLFVGIWYHGIDPAEGVIWVLNRVKPLKDSSGILKIAQDGNLVLLNGQKKVVWSSNVKNPVTSNTAARLLDSGNLVLQDKATGAKIWESFEHPSDVGVSTMRISVNVKTGEVVQLTSWKSPSDPSIGNFSFGLDPFNFLQIFVWKNSQPYWRSGPWNGQIFVGIPDMYSVPFDGLILGFDEQEGTKYLAINYVNFYLQDFRLDSVGRLIHRSWNGSLNKWDIFWSARKNECDSYGHCGPFGSCASQKPTICSCLPGFEPKNTEEWNRGIWTNGCVRRTMLQCNRTNNSNEVGKEDWFFKLEMVKLPDFFVQWSAVSEYECRKWCLKNCSCVAYAHPTGLNCLSWNENLTDIRKFSSSSSGTDLYLRLAYSERADLSISPAPAPQPEIGTVGPPPRAELHRMKKGNLIIVIITIFIGTISISAICIFFVRRRMAREKARPKGNEELLIGGRKIIRNEVELQEVPLFKFEELATATSNFNIANLLGKGGFGPVHRGTLQNGQEIAVKRLSRASGQGSDEFMNEVLVISNLQHRNLVKLLGCCVEGEEKILVYEYMPNNSLDTYLFDSLKKELLDWKKRFKIIEGISRGLLYLHRDSRLRIIHRDLKASNILLDEILQPKISDFGLAKIFGGNEDQANTKRIVGTRGYMSPEYAMEGLFSEKSDIYSYGVLLLEIISGRRNTGFYNDEHLSLVGYAWKLWKEGNILALVDNMVSDPCHHEEVLRGIHVGLLCVQEFAKDRPNMSTVISMLNSEIMDLPSPKQPAFTLRQNNASDAESCTHHDQQKCSINNVTLSNVEGR